MSVRNVADDAELFQLPGIGPLTDYEGLAFDEGGRHLMQCCQTPQGVSHRIWKLEGTPTLALSTYGVCDLSPDGRRLAAIDKDGSIAVYGLPLTGGGETVGKELRRYRLTGFVPDRLRWNPRRSLLFARSAGKKSYRLLDLGAARSDRPLHRRVILLGQAGIPPAVCWPSRKMGHPPPRFTL